ncbi:insulin-like growth factor 3 isoform X2 [Amphiprion ocellaris]|uniref:Insulin-like domain-containing protein n=1 Tax=Amphiprion ocellaris TaxID=80972 RepID=A0A3Q1D0B9_AMPOC|nr:insulin-like growth factor 3 isoform X2 [Amphiprion ocellaris]
MHSSSCTRAGPQTVKVLCVWISLFYSSMCLAGWPLTSEAARLRCGSKLLSDLIFVCGDRGIYFGKGSWSGYGGRPRGRGIVDQCCRSGGCELEHLEIYCAKPKSKTHTTATPATMTAPHTTTQLDMFHTVFQKRLSEHLGLLNSPNREAYRKKTQTSIQRKNKVRSRRKVLTQNKTIQPTPASGSPRYRITSFEY